MGLNMKKYLSIILFLFISNAFAGNEHEQQAEKWLELSGTKAAMETMTDMMLAQQLQQNPSLTPFEHIMRQFLEKHLSYESLKDDYIAMYVETFTKDELLAINKFYSTKVGAKAIKTMPNLMQRGGELGRSRVQDNISELQNMITEEAKKLNSH